MTKRKRASTGRITAADTIELVEADETRRGHNPMASQAIRPAPSTVPGRC
jgi:hypothetical protein